MCMLFTHISWSELQVQVEVGPPGAKVAKEVILPLYLLSIMLGGFDVILKGMNGMEVCCTLLNCVACVGACCGPL